MIHIRTSLPTAILYIFSFYKQPIIMYLDFVLILTWLFWPSCEWQVIDFEPYDTGSNRKKIYDNKDSSFNHVHECITCWTAALAPILPKISFGNFLPALVTELRPFHSFFFFSMSVSPITIPPFSPSSFQNCAYI